MKKNKTFNLPFIGMEEVSEYNIYYHEEGHYISTFEIVNPILTYSGNSEKYYQYQRVFTNIVKNLGDDFIVQKQDILYTTKYKGKDHKDYLSQKFFDNFKGREYKTIKSYLTIIKTVKRGNMFTFNEKEFNNFINKVNKVFELLKSEKFKPKKLSEKDLTILLKRFLSFSFSEELPKLDNIKSTDEHLIIRGKTLKTISLIDIDEINFPSQIKPYSIEDLGYDFPRDLFSFLSETPSIETLVYNQVIQIPNQKTEINGLERKKKRHTSMPDPANVIAVSDIDDVLYNIAKNNDLLVNSHYSLMLYGKEEDVTYATNFLESALFNIGGIIPSKNSYNQYELFLSGIPGNSVLLKDYDLFKTTLDPAISLFYKESYQVDEESNFQIYFTDRKGIPIAIDPADLPVETNRINNRNKFVLGPSGSGKSFFMNHLVRQYKNYDMDVILVDTGNSYQGICTYFNGKYVTYTEEKPITMNPFKLTESEYNEEKREFLKSLIMLIWKGVEGSMNAVEDTALTNTIFAYYNDYFTNQDLTIDYLSFDSFYEFALINFEKINRIEKVNLDVITFKFVTQKFYKGGDYDTILNEDADTALFDESFIVFEIDEIKEHKLLFPIVTVIIMDVFLQKMRQKKNRKALIIEEAWKAIASPNMANYILYLYKTVRKFRGEAVVVTQELDDIISNEVVKDSIINNSDTIILLDQTKFRDNFDVISDLLSISDVERNKIFTVNQLDNKDNRGRFKEVYIKRGDSGEVYGVEVSFEEYITYTTEKSEKEAFNHYLINFNGNYKEALETFVKDFNKYGGRLSQFSEIINEKFHIVKNKIK
ncbi:TraG family conjugative transposon ATPase [Tenacibaculum finnmarkense]|uniref:TraG family conjugative transposon ATPase n=1 Tax=Tenacibaculum finnmarkense TaxID=2781243 RepID=UPI001EFAB3A3|nr:TraG family conjugative transposon ATPase [Tenacibaculum finnmarkense]MCG8226384.1 TraG family conjugative transposon ATPase [Tenacibaculum finnmarkense genomovar finnmarkense]